MHEAILIVVPLLGVGCTKIDQYLTGSCPYPALPEPSVGVAAPPVLTEEEQRRADEATCFVAQFYNESGWRSLLTVQLPSGDIVDYLDPTSVPGSEIEPPPPPDYTLPSDVLPQRAEVEDLGAEYQGPPGSVPMIRPAFAPYVFGDVEATSLEEFIAQQASGQPDGQYRLYAGIDLLIPNTGAITFVNAYDGKVEPLTTNLLEMAVVCGGSDPDNTRELVGTVASRDRFNFDRGNPGFTRLQVEFYTAGYGVESTGPGKGGWEGMVMRGGKYKGQTVTGFIGRTGAPYAPGAVLTPVSTVGGAIYESRFEIRQVGGNWWIAHNGNWLGYYPREAFDVMPFGACQVHWYGEVFHRYPADWTPTDMGSGRFAAEGLGNAAHFRLPAYLDDASLPQVPIGIQPSKPYDPLCYTSSGPLDESPTRGPGFERIMYVGGPGGDSPGCN